MAQFKEERVCRIVNEAKKCAKCGGEMEIGTLNDAAFWRRGASLWSLRRGIRMFGFRCKSCELVVFYYGKNAKRFTQ